MRVRILAAVSAALLATALAPAAAFAGPVNPVPLKGTVWTTMAEASGPPALCTIPGKGDVPGAAEPGSLGHPVAVPGFTDAGQPLAD